MKRIVTIAASAILLASAVLYAPALAQMGPGPHPGGPGMRGPTMNGRGMIHWHGRVDDTVMVYFHGRRVSTQVIRGRGIANQGWNVDQPLPHAPVHVFIRSYDGRGRVRVVQQPNGANGFTAAVRIVDWQPGSSYYRVNIGWR